MVYTCLYSLGLSHEFEMETSEVFASPLPLGLGAASAGAFVRSPSVCKQRGFLPKFLARASNKQNDQPSCSQRSLLFAGILT